MWKVTLLVAFVLQLLFCQSMARLRTRKGEDGAVTVLLRVQQALNSGEWTMARWQQVVRI